MAFPFRRLAVWLGMLVLLVSLLATGIVSLLVVPGLQRNLESRRQTDLRQKSRVFDGAIERAVAASNGNDALNAGQAFEIVTGYKFALVERDAGGGLYQLLTSLPGAAENEAVLAAVASSRVTERRTVVDGNQVFARAVPFATGGRYVILLYQAPTDVSGQVSVVRRRVLIATIVALPLAALIGAGAASLLALRVRRLERSARAISSGRFDVPTVDPAPDEIGQLATAFDEMRQRLERTEQARREFIANASHELRTPLFALSGFLELLEDDEADEDERREFVETMRSQVSRLTRLATDLLDLSRLDAGRLELDVGPTDVTAVLALVAHEFEPAAERHGSAIAVIDEDVPVLALADDLRLGQIVRSLTHNAIRHTPPGTAIELMARRTDAGVVVDVWDSGPPLPDAVSGRVFERFVRGSAGEGSGLGLAIARELARRMGGDLAHVQDEAGKRFSLTLPAATDVATPVAST